MTADPELQAQVADAFRRHSVEVTEQEVEELAVYLELIEHWNKRINLTAIRDRPTAIVRHLVEAVLVRSTLAGAGPHIVDAGSGAGVPGIPMAIVDKDREIALVEANGKKATFLHEVVDRLELRHVRVVQGQLEDAIADGTLEGPVHVLVSRGWTSGWGSLLGQMASVMAPGGRAVLLTGEETQRALRRQLAQGSEQARVNVPEWRDAANAGWRLRRARPLPHLDRGYMVTLELPTP